MRLILLRHAKSDWKTAAPTDHARPLNARGRRDAPRIGAALRARGWIPTRVVCSDAARTRETWARMGPVLAPEAPLQTTPALYHAGIEAIQDTIAGARADGGTAVLLLLGHNPGWEDALPLLCGTAAPLTTCNAALLAPDGPDRWRLVDVLRPREL